MKEATPTQLKVLEMIDEHTKAHGYPPTIREIGSHFGWSSTNAISSHCEALIKKGLLIRDGRKARSFRVVQVRSETIEGLRIERDLLRVGLHVLQEKYAAVVAERDAAIRTCQILYGHRRSND